ncbi:cytoplasmic protein [Kibdelosporangium aridum]|uniref:Cytoplasmic protein n=1 Tax=Kibdelosporangium aridum TaxID=2030 RepID=A0A428YTA0_KIBAR|nr:STM4015 family protein [Kibdelosporangium aridum]RSM72616.1 cytoplasmic protein [Kibdelosporangium aridum]
MTVNQHLTTFHGMNVVAFPEETTEAWRPPAEPVAWRLAIEPWDGDETFPELWDRFLSTVDPSTVTAVVIGQWAEPGDDIRSNTVIERILGARDKMPALTGIFLGDMISEENEISWIEQSDVTPLLENLPALTELGIRGGDGLVLKPVRHNNLRTLIIETGGLPREVVSGVAQSDFPALQELRLWLGVDEYGGNWRPEDLEPLLAGDKVPSLRELGLQNSDRQDKVCELVAGSAIVRQLTTLDLSMGVLTDKGGEHLLSLTHLTNLDLTHHYLSKEMRKQILQALPPAGVRVILDDAQEPDHYDGEPYYYTAVAE